MQRARERERLRARFVLVHIRAAATGTQIIMIKREMRATIGHTRRSPHALVEQHRRVPKSITRHRGAPSASLSKLALFKKNKKRNKTSFEGVN